MDKFANESAFGLPMDDEQELKLDEKIQAVFAPDDRELNAYMVNTLLEHIPAAKLHDNIGTVFTLYGYYSKKVKFSDGKSGRITFLFGRNMDDTAPCAYTTASDKVYDALRTIAMVYDNKFVHGVKVKIRMNTHENGKSYTLKVV